MGNNLEEVEHLLLIDGSGFIFRAYHALPPLIKSDGTPTGAVAGYCNMLFKILNEMEKFKATHLAVIFDQKDKTFRSDIYPEYKANRPPPPEDLVPQFDIIREATNAFGIISIEKKGFEADDLIATLSKKANDIGAKVTIFSSDKDLMQLVSEKTLMYDPIKNTYINIDKVKEKFGVSPNKVIEVQSLIGDAVDNVPGVPGIGIKTASQLISNFNTVENLIDNNAQIDRQRIRDLILTNIDNIRMSKALVTLNKKVPTDIEINQLMLKPISPEKLINFTNFMELRTLSKRIENKYQLNIDSDPKESDGTESSIINAKDYETVISLEQLQNWCKKIRKQKYFSVDTETTSLDEMKAVLVGISMCVKPGEACYIPIGHSTGDTLTKEKCDYISIYSQLDLETVLQHLSPLFRDKTILKIGQNIKYDIKVLNKYGISFSSFDDTMLMSNCIYGGLQKHSLDFLSSFILNHEPIKIKDLIGSGKNALTFDKIPIHVATSYAAEDADITLRIWETLKIKLVEKSVYSVYHNLDKPMISVLLKAELEGIKVDQPQLENLSKYFEKKINELEKEIFKESRQEFNIGSPKQLGDILFKTLGLPNGKRNKSGAFQTSADILEHLSLNGHAIAILVLEWRKISKLKSTYTDSLRSHINPKTGRIHTSYNLAGTSTGRLSSSDPNLQNIPIRDEEGRKIREAFVSKRGSVLLSLDYNQIELRILAHMADVKELKNAFRKNIDIHSSTASQIFGVSLEKVDSSLRRKAKAINFGIIYGISAFGLANNLKISRSEAKMFIDNYFEKFPEIKNYMEKTVGLAKEFGFVRTLFNRKIHFKDINAKGPLGSFSERAAINAPIQGTASDIIKRAMIKIDNFLENSEMESRLLLQVHDELIFETSEIHLNNLLKSASDIMEKANLPYLSLDVPLKVEGDYGLNWSKAH